MTLKNDPQITPKTPKLGVQNSKIPISEIWTPKWSFLVIFAFWPTPIGLKWPFWGVQKHLFLSSYGKRGSKNSVTPFEIVFFILSKTEKTDIFLIKITFYGSYRISIKSRKVDTSFSILKIVFSQI